MRSLPRRLSLPTILIVPFVVQVVTAVSLVGYLSFVNGQKGVNNLATQLRQELAIRIKNELATYLQTPEQFNEINAIALREGQIDFDKGRALPSLSQQLKMSNYIYGLYCGSRQGEMFGSFRVNQQEFGTSLASAATNQELHLFNIDSQGQRGAFTRSAGKYDPRQRPWYKTAVEVSRPTWGEVYFDFDTKLPALTASQPVYSATKELVGVCGVDLLLSEQFQQFLADLQIGKTGIAFIMTRKGELVASSTKTPIMTGEGKDAKLIPAQDSKSPLIQATAAYLQTQTGGLGAINQLQQLNFPFQQQQQLLAAMPFTNSGGLDWVIVVVVPEQDFMGEINANNQTTILLCILALGVAIALGIFTSRWIVGLILKLRNASQEITAGNLEQTVNIAGVTELEDLSYVFNQMAGQLKTSFDNKEQLVQERTKELSEALENLQTTQRELIQSEKMAALGQLVAGIAHEINTPLGAIRASITNIISGLEASLNQLPQLLQKLSPSQETEFISFLTAACQVHPYLSTREVRKLKRALTQELETYGMEDPDALADSLVQMGIVENLTDFLPLLRSEHGESVIETANHLSSQFRNSDNINVAVDRAAKIIYALKSYVRQDTSGEKVMAKITENIDIVLTLYHNQMKQKIELIQNYQPVPEILCYPEELSQVWTNLIHNAIQAINSKGTLQINVFQQDQSIVVQVIDSGVGISPEIQEKIFEPFFTTKPAGEGSGLGLDIVSKIIKKHGGSIAVSSQPGQTAFSVFLPIS